MLKEDVTVEEKKSTENNSEANAKTEATPANAPCEKEIEKKSYDYSGLELTALVKHFELALKKENTNIIKTEVAEIRYQFDKKFSAILAGKKAAFLEAGGESIDFHYESPIKKEFNKLVGQYRMRREKEAEQKRKQQQENLSKKEAIVKELKEIVAEKADEKGAYKAVKELEAKWKSIGEIPREHMRILQGDYRHHLNKFYELSRLSQSLREGEYQRNLEKKEKLIQLAKDLDAEKDISKAVTILKELHLKWKKETGPISHHKKEEVWKAFTDASSVIREKHRAFLNAQRGDQKENQKRKEALLEKLKTLDPSSNNSITDWKKMSDEITPLEREYLAIGPAPKEANKELWRGFMNIINSFKRERNHFFKQLKTEEKQNLIAKKELIEQIITITNSDDFEKQNETVKELQQKWKTIGNIPFKNLQKIRKEFRTVCDDYYNKLRNSGWGNAQHNIRTLTHKKEKLEKEKKQLENNIGFFAHQPKENPMVMRINNSIENLKKELDELNQKILELKKSTD